MLSFYDELDRTFEFGTYPASQLSNKIMDELILQCGCVQVVRANESLASSTTNYASCTWNGLAIRLYGDSSTMRIYLVVYRNSGTSFSTYFYIFFDYPKIYLKFRFMKCTTGFAMLINTTNDLSQYVPILVGIHCKELSTNDTKYCLYIDGNSHYITVSDSAYPEEVERFDAFGRAYPTSNKQILDIMVIYHNVSLSVYYTAYVGINAYCGASLYQNQVIYDGTDYYFSMRLVSIKLTPVEVV